MKNHFNDFEVGDISPKWENTATRVKLSGNGQWHFERGSTSKFNF